MKNRFNWKTFLPFGAPFALWGLLLLVFAPGRICTPVFSGECVSRAWNYVGDAIWLSDLERWQTTFAGVMALSAAFVSMYFISKQIKQSEKHERERLKRKQLAARAVLPLMLSHLMTYTQACAEALKEALDNCVDDRLPRTAARPQPPAVPLDLVMELKQSIESSPSSIGERIADILSDLQVLDARLRDISETSDASILLAINIETYVLNVVELDARASSAFHYARRTSDTIGDDNDVADRLLTSMRLLGFRDDDYRQLIEAATRRASKLKEGSITVRQSSEH